MAKNAVNATINSNSEINSENQNQNPASLANYTRDIKTYSKQNLPWSCNALTKRIDKQEAVFDSAVQRTYVWTADQKSLLIHSLIIGAPIPPMYATKETVETENGNTKSIYSFLDGKQRSNAIHDYINGLYALTNVPPIDFEDGSQADINGLYFNDLSDAMKDNIKNTNLVIYVFENLSDDQTADIFYRLNNGKSLSAIELSRVKAVSLPAFQEIARSPLFENSLSAKQIAKYGAEDIAIKAHIMAYSDTKCTDTKFVRPYVEATEVTENQISELKSVFGFVQQIVESANDTENKSVKRAVKRIVTRTHLLSMIPLYLSAVRGEMPDRELVKQFVLWFFGTTKTSVSAIYNNYATQGSGHEDHIAKRLSAINAEFESFKKDYAANIANAKAEAENTSAEAESNTNTETETENQNPNPNEEQENEQEKAQENKQDAQHTRYYVKNPDGSEMVYDYNKGFYSFITSDDFPIYWNNLSYEDRLRDADTLDFKWEDTIPSAAEEDLTAGNVLASHEVKE